MHSEAAAIVEQDPGGNMSVQEYSPLNNVAGFKYAWMLIVARSWRYPAYYNQLLAHGKDHQFVATEFATVGKFNLPMDMSVEIVKTVTPPEPPGMGDEVSPVPAGDKYGWDGREWRLPKAVARLSLPPPPERQDEFAIALAHYGYMSRGLPLSCC